VSGSTGCTLGACDEVNNCDLVAKDLELVSSQKPKAEISVSPNPFKDDLEIFMNVTEENEYTVNIYDVFGKVVSTVFSGKMNAYEYSSYRVNLTHLLPGVYFVGVDNGESQQVNARIIKQ
jgi:hypothetical protein